MIARKPTVAFVVLVAASSSLVYCGDATREVAGQDAGTNTPHDASAPPPDVIGKNGHDLSKGKWTVTQVSNTPGTISHDGSIAFLPDGTAWAAWSEPDPIATSHQNIWVGSRTNTGWNGAPLTTDTTIQNAYPFLLEWQGTLQLAFNSYPATDNDIFISAYDKGVWSPRLDLTSFDEGKYLRSDFQPNMVIGAEGRMVLSYGSQPADAQGGPVGPSYIRILEMPSGAIPNGAPENVITDPAGCYSSSLAVDKGGHLHLVADCGPLNDLDIVYATNRSGTWQTQVIPGGTGAYESSPSLVIDPDGITLHLAWTRSLPCAAKPKSNCSAVHYTTIKDEVIAAPRRITNEPNLNEATCKLIVDELGQVLIGFQRFNAANFSDVFATWSANGTTFSTPINLTPNTDNQDDNGPTSFVLHPKTGNIHLLYWSVVPKSSPLNSDIWHAEFVPETGPIN